MAVVKIRNAKDCIARIDESAADVEANIGARIDRARIVIVYEGKDGIRRKIAAGRYRNVCVLADLASATIQDLERGVADDVEVVGRANINERALPDAATALSDDLYVKIIGSGNIRGTNHDIGVAGNAVPVGDSQTRRLSRRV